MKVTCLVHRLDEEPSDGILFETVREAVDYIKEQNDVKEWTITPVEIEE